MRVYLMRTTGADPDYEVIEASSFGGIRAMTRALHVPTRRFDPAQDEGMYVHAVMCQGVSLQSFDHYAIVPRGGYVQLYGWNDDTDDHAQPWGVVWEFRKPAPSQRLGGRVNTVQYLTVYGDDPPDHGVNTEAGPVVYKPWADWRDPPPGLEFHGIWTDDDTNERHFGAIGRGNLEHGWREWAEDGDD